MKSTTVTMHAPRSCITLLSVLSNAGDPFLSFVSYVHIFVTFAGLINITATSSKKRINKLAQHVYRPGLLVSARTSPSMEEIEGESIKESALCK